MYLTPALQRTIIECDKIPTLGKKNTRDKYIERIK